MKKICRYLGSLKLTTALLAISTLMVLLGTLDQANYGIHHAQERYFHSWVVVSPVVALLALPITKSYPEHLEALALPLPGGLLLGVLLIVNLVCADLSYFKPGWRRLGLAISHGGVILLIVSGFLGSLMQKEWQIVLDEGGGPVRHMSAIRGSELALLRTDPGEEESTETTFRHLIDESNVRSGHRETIPGTNLTLVIEDATPHSMVESRGRLLAILTSDNPAGSGVKGDPDRFIRLVREETLPLVPLSGRNLTRVDPGLLRGLAAERNLVAMAQPPTYQLDEGNLEAALVRVEADGDPLGVWLTATVLPLIESLPPQTFRHDGKTYRLELRRPRKNLPFSLALTDFTHRRHPNTDIPAEFASDVVLVNPETEENRNVHISMNQPLRYHGYTFYQASFANDDRTSILQVVRNPGRLLPYISITLVGLGLLLHFALKLFGYVARAHARAHAD